MYLLMSYAYIPVHVSAYVKKGQDLVRFESQKGKLIINKNVGLNSDTWVPVLVLLQSNPVTLNLPSLFSLS